MSQHSTGSDRVADSTVTESLDFLFLGIFPTRLFSLSGIFPILILILMVVLAASLSMSDSRKYL